MELTIKWTSEAKLSLEYSILTLAIVPFNAQVICSRLPTRQTSVPLSGEVTIREGTTEKSAFDASVTFASLVLVTFTRPNVLIEPTGIFDQV